MSARRADLVAAALLLALGGAALWTSWGTWPHAFVDFGRELYVPWRLAEGELLYRDVAWFNGPLSAWWNALLFRAFGPGLGVLVGANLALVAGLVALLYVLLGRVGDRVGATAACALFLLAFAFHRFDPIGNDNFLTPYSHEVVHGLLLGLAGLACFAVRRPAPQLAALGSGLALGLVALTKSELLVATAAGLGLGWALELAARRERGRLLALLALGTGAGPLLAFLTLWSHLPAADALAGASGSWLPLLTSDVASLPFYRATLGSLHAGENLRAALGWLLAEGLAVVAILAVGRVLGRDGEGGGAGLAAPLALGLGTFAFVLSLAPSWPEALRPLPVVMAGLLVAGLAGLRRAGSGDGLLRVALLAFALALLAKVLLRVRLDQYGFALAMPATLLAVVALVSWLPRAAERLGGSAVATRAGALGLVAAAAVGSFALGLQTAGERTEVVASGRDAFRAEPALGAELRATLTAIERHVPPDATLAVLPEGVMLNYLARRRNPTGVVNAMPPELAMFGEDALLERFRAAPPDWIAIARRDVSEYGVGPFGRGYGQRLFAWVLENYRPIDDRAPNGRPRAVRLWERRGRSAL